MSRRLFDIVMSALSLAVLALPLGITLILVWWQDRHSPLYIADRVGLAGKPFRMIKIRSMVIDADKTGVDSTSSNDARITALGHFIRRWKIDELGQLFNVLKGDMSLVGPRPNTLGEFATYSKMEQNLLSVRPGITDFSSIVFSDEGNILKDSRDPNADYTRLIRPWKSELGLLYVRNASLLLNIQLIWLTLVAIILKEKALISLNRLLATYGASDQLLTVSLRRQSLHI